MRDPDEDKHLKVKLPIRQHIQLHSLKVQTGRTLSQLVEEAVDCYLETLDDDRTDKVEQMFHEVRPGSTG